MTCTYDREQLALYVNQDATTAEGAATLEHLAGCAECRRIIQQYEATALRLAGTHTESAPVRLSSRRPSSLWRRLTAAAATLVALLGLMQVPAVAAQVSKAFPFMEVFEMDRAGVAAFIERFHRDEKAGGQIIRPQTYETLAEAEEAWGSRIPQPTALPADMILHRIEHYRYKAGGGQLFLYYFNPKAGGNLAFKLSTLSPQQMVPRGATSKTRVNGAEAVVVRGSFTRFLGQPLQWEPDSEIKLFFPLGDLYAEVATAGKNTTLSLDDLVKIAESIQ